MTAIDIPGYLIRREVGAGGMASVYLALQTSLDREVALKVMSPALAADPSFSKRFLQEARMLASLAHPNIVQVYDVGVTPGQLNYFSMQYLSAGDFAQRVRGGISEKDLVRILEGVSHALGYAHQRGYVHRDVAPGNILFDVNDTPLLTDFGIARALSQGARITSAGISVGTSHYMSPEQARGGEVDARSDLYGLGVLTWFGLTGKPPYEGADGFAVSYAHVFEPIPRLPAEQAHWQPLIDKALAKDPAHRYQSADEFAAALAALEVRAPVLATREAEAPTRPIKREALNTALRASEAVTTIGVIPPIDESNVLGKVNDDQVIARTKGRGLSWVIAALGLILIVGVGYALLGNNRAERVVASEKPLENAPAETEMPPSSSSVTPISEVSVSEQTAEVVAAPETSSEPELDLALADDEKLDLSKVPTVIDPVAEQLRLARNDLTGQRLMNPPRFNAFERFSLALRIDPKSKAARQGILDTAQAYFDLAEKAWASQNPAEFVGYLAKVKEVARSIPEGASVVAAANARSAREIDQYLADAAVAAERWDRQATKAAYEKALALDEGNVKARTGLRGVDRIGAPGFVFRDKSGPEMIVVTSNLAFARRETSRGEFANWWRAGGQKEFSGKDPSCRDRESLFRSSRKRNWQAPGIEQDDSHPVVCVSFAQAQAFASWLSKQTGERYRLPTPAEWEQVARLAPAGSCASANLADASFKRKFDSKAGAECDDGHASTAPTGRYPAVSGLFDMDGNVREWVAACGKSAPLTATCRDHGARGRGWLSPADKESVIQSDSYADDVSLNSLGIRLVRDIEK